MFQHVHKLFNGFTDETKDWLSKRFGHLSHFGHTFPIMHSSGITKMGEFFHTLPKWSIFCDRFKTE